MNKMTPAQKIILILLSLTALCLCALAIALAPIVPQDSPAAPPTNYTPSPPTLTVIPVAATPLQHRSAGAIIQCRQFVKDRLVSPSSAEFGYEEAYKVNGEPMNYHAVVGVVESQNQIGVWLRSEYRCDVHYLPDQPTLWVLDYLDID